jgi:Domain of unknown function (DUF4276)
VVKLYVEGGGDSALLKTACREGFTTFITKAGLKRRPRIVACGGRRDAYDSFCTAIKNGEVAFLLVDSENFVLANNQQGADPTNWKPWVHLKEREGDKWDRPNGCSDSECHLMVQVMETWFLADRAAVKDFFGQGYKENKLPAIQNAIEGIAKSEVHRSLGEATKACKSKAEYGKGEHSFKLLTKIDPNLVTNASPWAKRFIDMLKVKLD